MSVVVTLSITLYKTEKDIYELIIDQFFFGPDLLFRNTLKGNFIDSYLNTLISMSVKVIYK